MSIIQVQNMTFAYEGSYDTIFKNVSFSLDTDWKTGFIGRNGRGKTTFLKLLMGWERPTGGNIAASVHFDYFPFPVEDGRQTALEAARAMIAPFSCWERRMDELLTEATDQSLEAYGELQQRSMEADGYIIDELITREAGKLHIAGEALGRPFGTLSPGERTRLTLAALFLKKNNFLLIDEPTNHLDIEGRQLAGDYLAEKKGFILVSHDRDFLDRVVDHVISVNRTDIEVQQGNYSTWKLNRDRQDQFELARNESLKRDIVRLTASAERAGQWSDRVEASKIGEHAYDRGYVGHKAAKMMQRSKSIERRQLAAAEEKRTLLKNLEESEPLKLVCPPYTRGRLIEAPDLTLSYGSKAAVSHLRLELEPGERICLAGRNGCGKSTVIRYLTGAPGITAHGSCRLGPGLTYSYVPQDTAFLRGGLRAFAQQEGLDESLFKAILRKLDFSRIQFEKDMDEFSSGQKKKVLIAASLCRPAHLYLWDEPLNFIDILSRIQVEELILRYQPTMIFVEHDAAFCRKIATRTLRLDQA